MISKEKIHDYTDIYVESYMRALEKVHNPDLAVQAAMATNALEKAVPKSPKEKNLDFGDKVIVCPNCGISAIGNMFSRNGKQYPHCPWCGQKLKEEEE